MPTDKPTDVGQVDRRWALRRPRVTLKAIQDARARNFLHNLNHAASGQRSFDRAVDELVNPTRSHLSKLSDDDLAELISTEPTTRVGRLADSILRTRDNWRSPAKWSLGVSIISLLIAVAAFVQATVKT